MACGSWNTQTLDHDIAARNRRVYQSPYMLHVALDMAIQCETHNPSVPNAPSNTSEWVLGR